MVALAQFQADTCIHHIFTITEAAAVAEAGIIARAEVTLVGAQYAADTDGVNKINGANVVRFYLNTFAVAMNSIRQIWFNDASGKALEFSKLTKDATTAATIDAKLASNNVMSNKLTVRGAASTPMKWRAEIKISSILKV